MAKPTIPNATGRDALTPSQRAAIAVLAAGETYDKAAEAAGVARPTVSRWMTVPAFVAALDAEVDATIAVARRELRRGATLFVTTLLDVASNPDAPAAARVQAAKEGLNRIGVVEAAIVQHAGHDGGPLVAIESALRAGDDAAIAALAKALKGDP